MLSKGAYLTSERRRLFFKLGEEAYKKMLQGQWKDKELEGLVHQLERINKKVEIEEMLIQSMRFGKKPIRKTSPQSQSPTSLEGQP